MDNSAEYYLHRAAAEFRLATLATAEPVISAHYRLCRHFLARAAEEMPAYPAFLRQVREATLPKITRE